MRKFIFCIKDYNITYIVYSTIYNVYGYNKFLVYTLFDNFTKGIKKFHFFSISISIYNIG